MSLLTGKRLHAYSWNELPIPDEVIDRVHLLAKEDGQKELVNGSLTFEWNIGTEIEEYSDVDEESEDGRTIEIIDEYTHEHQNAYSENDNNINENDENSQTSSEESDVVNDSTEGDTTRIADDEIDEIFKNAELQLDKELDEIRNNYNMEEANYVSNILGDLEINEDRTNEEQANEEITNEIDNITTTVQNEHERDEQTEEIDVNRRHSERSRRPPERLIPEMGGKVYQSSRTKQYLQAKRINRMSKRAKVTLMMNKARKERRDEFQLFH